MFVHLQENVKNKCLASILTHLVNIVDMFVKIYFLNVYLSIHFGMGAVGLKKCMFDIMLTVIDVLLHFVTLLGCRFGKRVSRAFSFNRTPRKLKRAMSSMSQVMSPFRRDSLTFLNPNHVTPRSGTRGDLRSMRLASTNDLTVCTRFYLDCNHRLCHYGEIYIAVL